MGFGLKYKNKETVFEEKIMEGVPLLTYPLLEKQNTFCLFHELFSVVLVM